MNARTVGIYNLFMRMKGGGEKRTLVLAEHWSTRHRVLLFVAEPVDKRALEEYFDVDLSAVDMVTLDGTDEADHARQIQAAGLDVFVNNSYASNLESPAPRSIFMCMFPHRRGSGWDAHPPSIDTYDVVTANSRFTAGWVQRWWGRDAVVVYSACDSIGCAPSVKKARIILNVGRFRGDMPRGLQKRQDFLLDTFLRLRRLHDTGWELHFVGSEPVEEAGDTLLNHIQQRAQGYPVRFHVGVSRAKLLDLYRRASIYWHATGYGHSAKWEPGRQEHFGMTTVEAMSAGAVPVVLASGGHLETVTNGVDGFLWSRPRQLASRTKRLATDPRLLRRMSDQATESSGRFTHGLFTELMDRVLDDLLDAPSEHHL